MPAPVDDLVLDAARQANELLKARADLKLAKRLIERQRLELDSLSGRAAVVKAAASEAVLRGSPWSQPEVVRFNALPKADGGRASFASDELSEVLRQGVGAGKRRVAEAASEAAKARSDAAAATADGTIEQAGALIEQAFDHKEQRAWMRTMLSGCKRTATKLRAATARLEEDATEAMAVHATAMRGLSARLLAQQDALCESFADELREGDAARREGLECIERLRGELAGREGTIGVHEHEIGELRGALKAQGRALSDEAKYRAQEGARGAARIATLEAHVARLEEDLAGSRRAHTADSATWRSALREAEGAHASDGAALARELKRCEKGRLAEIKELTVAHRAELKAVEAERYAERLAHEQQLGRLTGEGAASAEALTRQLEALERQAHAQLGALQARLEEEQRQRQHEMRYYKARIAKLTHKATALRAAGNATGRRLFYWESMKQKTGEYLAAVRAAAGLREQEPEPGALAGRDAASGVVR